MGSSGSWEVPCSDCSAQLAGKRSSTQAHEYLMRITARPGVYECLICRTILGCNAGGEWHAILSTPDIAAGLLHEPTGSGESGGHRLG